MVSRTVDTGNDGSSTENVMLGILVLLADDRERRLSEPSDPPKTEVVLARAGLTAPEIAKLMGKTVDAVRKTLQRSK